MDPPVAPEAKRSPLPKGVSSALHAAAEAGAADAVHRLLATGFDVNGRDGAGRTPLRVAAAAGLVPVCRVLLAAGADPGAKRADGRWPSDTTCLNITHGAC